jgi:MtrB/PioB family decaheme-associated outer membrane protein
MKTTMQPRLLFGALIALAAAGPAFAGQGSPAGAAQEPATPSSQAGSVSIGLRLTDISGDPARNQRYRDLREGPVVDGFHYFLDKRSWRFDTSADHVGYRDQQYFAGIEKLGRLKASFEWNSIPLFNSADTRTLYTQPSPGVFRLDDSIQSGIQAGTATLANFTSQAVPFDLRSRRDVARVKLTITPTRNTDLTLNVTTTNRTGAQQWGGGFSFSNVVEIPAPIQHRTTDVDTGAEWANSRGMARIGYAGSWFNDRVPTLVFDNPLRLTDTATATSQGQMSRWPDSSTQGVNASGLLKLPLRTTATAYLSVGRWNQNAPLIPFTINPAIAVIPLPRTTAEAKADVTAMNYTVATQPRRDLLLSARFNRYDFDNKTEPFPITNYVRVDSAVVALPSGGIDPRGYIRNNFEANASYTAIPWTALRFGYGREDVHRNFRYFETTAENFWRASVDLSGNTYLMVRVIYERSKRTGTGLDEQVLDDVGEQVSLRQFDMSNRERYRVNTVVQVTPINAIGITGTIISGNDTRPDAAFGLASSKQRGYTLGIDAVPHDGTTLGLTYGFEDYQTLQNSRQASPGTQFNDPTRNWSDSGFDRVHTVSASADFTTLIPRTAVNLSYDRSFARDRYVYAVPANSTLNPVSQLPGLLNDRERGTAEVKYRLRRDLTASLVYWYDHYRVDDFAFGQGTLSRLDLAGALLLGNVYRPYTMNTVTLRLNYTW